MTCTKRSVIDNSAQKRLASTKVQTLDKIYFYQGKAKVKQKYRKIEKRNKNKNKTKQNLTDKMIRVLLLFPNMISVARKKQA